MSDKTVPDFEEVAAIECFQPIEALEEEWKLFIRCWSCDEIINSDVFPECDDCMIRRGPERRWCCPAESDIPGFQMALTCHWNAAYWGRWETVFHRRALVA